jgi:hypothetical protein
MSTKTYKVFQKQFFELMDKLDQQYWCTHTGVDGYLYLLFQRRFYKLTQYMILISVGSQCVLYFIEEDFTFSFFGEIKKNEKHHISKMKAWMSIFIIFVYTILTINLLVQKTRRDAKVAMQVYY